MVILKYFKVLNMTLLFHLKNTFNLSFYESCMFYNLNIYLLIILYIDLDAFTSNQLVNSTDFEWTDPNTFQDVNSINGTLQLGMFIYSFYFK